LNVKDKSSVYNEFNIKTVPETTAVVNAKVTKERLSPTLFRLLFVVPEHVSFSFAGNPKTTHFEPDNFSDAQSTELGI
jgi:hypothetical protein